MERIVPTTPEEFKQQSLDLLAGQLVMYGAYPGYAQQRLWIADGPDVTPDGRMALPFGFDALLSTQQPDVEERRLFVRLGLEIDYPHGRPVHPWVNDMISRRDIGVLTGKGAYHHWGPNHTADPIVFRTTDEGVDVLLIQRGDTGAWALPGGFVEFGDGALHTAVLEAGQETSLDISGLAHHAQLVYQGPLADLRVTANAWPETSAFLFDATGANLPAPAAGDDAVNAAWVPRKHCGDILFGSHSLLVGIAGAIYDSRT